MESPTFTQDNLLLTVQTPLGKNRLLFKSLQGEEQICGLFHFQIEMLSEWKDLDFDDLVSKPLTVKVEFAPNHVRYFNGVITRFVQSGTFAHPNTRARMTCYHADIRPWLWQLTLTKNCRIFQHLSVPQIIQKVFDDFGLTDYRFSLLYLYEKRTYCVQYEETAFQFISRLMEDEGLFYFFEHTENKHTLVIADDLSAHPPCPEVSTARFLEISNQTQPENTIIACQFLQQMTTDNYAIDDFNFETPRYDLKTSVTARTEQQTSHMRIYEYDAGFGKRSRGEKKVDRRLESHLANYQLLEGQSHGFSFTSGYRFTLKDHPRKEFNAEYVLRWVSHSLSFDHYSNTFQAFPKDVSFRPPITTPKPKIISPQTAIVTGPAGEEIYTDKYGRIKVQFHWDQEGKYDENSSCWIRVNQGWAGKAWGHISIPRIGQEVIVSFLNGNPDTPLVMGSVYNAQQVVPYPLPENQTKSTLKSNSSKGGQGFNEIRFEDKKGHEQIFVHAERNQDIRVKKDTFEWIGEDRHLVVNANQYEEVKKDKNQQVKGDQFEAISHDANLKVGDNYHVSVGKNHDLQVGADLSVKVSNGKNVSVGANFNLNVGATISSKSDKVQQKVDKEYVLCVKEVIDIGSGKTLKLSAKDKLTLEVGGNFITIDSSGIALKGTQILLNSGGCPGDSSKCEPKKPKVACPPDPCTDPCQAGNANSGWRSIVENALNSLDIEAGIGLDGSYKVGVSGGIGSLTGSGEISGNLRKGELKYEAKGNLDTRFVDGNAEISGDGDGNLEYKAGGSLDTDVVDATGQFSGDGDGNHQYSGTAAGVLGPVNLGGGFKGDSEGNFNAWINAGLNMGNLLNQASKDGTPLVEVCE